MNTPTTIPGLARQAPQYIAAVFDGAGNLLSRFPGDTVAEARGPATRDWAERQAKWSLEPDGTGIADPPMWDLYRRTPDGNYEKAKGE